MSGQSGLWIGSRSIFAQRRIDCRPSFASTGRPRPETERTRNPGQFFENQFKIPGFFSSRATSTRDPVNKTRPGPIVSRPCKYPDGSGSRSISQNPFFYRHSSRRPQPLPSSHRTLGNFPGNRHYLRQSAGRRFCQTGHETAARKIVGDSQWARSR